MTKFSKLKVGGKISETQFYSVEKIVGDQVQLKNENGEDIVVTKEYAESCLTTADQYEKEEKITKTEAATLLTANANVALTVNFNKQVDPKDVEKEIMDAYKNSTPAQIETAVKKAVKSAISGVERTMVGYHFGSINEFGRINFIDMEANGNRTRQVDPRTINFLIIKGVKYITK